MSINAAVAIPAGMELCPICGQHRKAKVFKKLYGMPVCRTCVNAFANRRQGAYLLDWILGTIASGFFGAVVGFLFPTAFDPLDAGMFSSNAFWIVYSWILFPLVFNCKDGFRGHSPGKWLTGVQVVDEASLEPAGFWRSFKRNMCLMVPIVPLVVAFQLIRGRRMGDKWAKTKVIWKKHRHRVPFDTRGVLCHGCGYDLTGNVSGRCPECGLTIAQPIARPMNPPAPVFLRPEDRVPGRPVG